MNNKIVTVGVVVIMFASVLSLFKVENKNNLFSGASGQGSQADACTLATSTEMVIGKDIPTVISATSSNRANLTIQGINGASTTIALAFNGATASTGTAFLLNTYTRILNAQGATSTSSPIYYAGLATDNPYIGAISAVALTATTTGLVTECRY